MHSNFMFIKFYLLNIPTSDKKFSKLNNVSFTLASVSLLSAFSYFLAYLLFLI